MGDVSTLGTDNLSGSDDASYKKLIFHGDEATAGMVVGDKSAIGTIQKILAGKIHSDEFKKHL
jgi:hypothetical protein